MNRPRAAALLLLALLSGGVQARARPEPPEPAAQTKDDPVVIAKRAIVLDPQADPLAIASAATTLLERGDIGTLRVALSGEARGPALGVLAALGQADPDRAEPLLEDVVALSARTTNAELRASADSALDNLMRGAAPGQPAPPRLQRALGWLTDAAVDPAKRVVVLRALGRSSDLRYVEPLVGALADGNADEARAALLELTGRDLGPKAGVKEWGEWWDKHRRMTLEQVISESNKVMRTQLGEKDAKLIAARIEIHGNEVSGLIAGLSDEFADVRLEDARRLAGKANDEKAASAVPILLARLGHAASDPPASDQPAGDPAADPPDAGCETDPRVRVELIKALGVLGRNSDVVRGALVAELRQPNAAVSAAAAATLEQFRNAREIVRPLLAYLASLPKSDAAEAVDARVKALAAIASNSPAGVAGDLQPYLDSKQPASVRAAAVRALLACDEIGASLGGLGQIYRQDPSPEVHYAVAAALGDRLAGLGADADAALRTTMITMLGDLLQDLDASVRLGAAAALGRSGAAGSLALLERRMHVETDPAVQRGLVAAVGALHQPDGVRVLGELLAGHKDGREVLLDEAKKAIAAIAGERAPQPWLDAATALSVAGAHDLAVYCDNEVDTRFGQAPDQRAAVDQANGQRAVELLADGQLKDARALLEQLETADAQLPPRGERQLKLADVCGRLKDWGAQGDWLKKHLAALPAADAARAPETLAAAQALEKAGRHDAALPLYRDYVTAQPADNQALFELVSVEETMGQFEAALHDLDGLIQKLPEGDALREPAQAARTRLQQHTAAAPAAPATPPAKDKQSEPAPAASAPAADPPHGG